MTSTVRVIVLYALAGVQTLTPTSEQSFEAASVKPAAPSSRPIYVMHGGPGTPNPGQITYLAVPLRALIKRAYGVEEYQLVGPKWMETSKYDIVAKVPKDTDKATLGILLQNLLAQRFQMKCHYENVEVPGYHLLIASNGPRMKEAAAPPPTSDITKHAAVPENDYDALPRDDKGLPEFLPGARRRGIIPLPGGVTRISGRMQTMKDIEAMCRNNTEAPIVDQTGLTGTYDFNLDYAPLGVMPSGASTANIEITATDFATSLRQQLGLYLAKAMVPTKVLVIERALRMPTEN
jgi:uncharacterized protein (TIGR03435 family)